MKAKQINVNNCKSNRKLISRVANGKFSSSQVKDHTKEKLCGLFAQTILKFQNMTFLVVDKLSDHLE